MEISAIFDLQFLFSRNDNEKYARIAQSSWSNELKRKSQISLDCWWVYPDPFGAKKHQEIHMISSSQASIDRCIKSMKVNYSRIALKCALNRPCIQNKKARPSNISFWKESLSYFAPGRQHNLQFLTKALFVLHIKTHCFGAMGIPLILNCNSS